MSSPNQTFLWKIVLVRTILKNLAALGARACPPDVSTVPPDSAISREITYKNRYIPNL
jgi:hypothetical protein